MESGDRDQEILETHPQSKPLVLAIAEAVAEWFPQLGGRSIAASEIDPFNAAVDVPTLPLAVTALLSETNNQAQNGSQSINLTTDVMLVFMFKPVRYRREDGANTPFYTFYNYEPIRNTILERLQTFRTPNNGSIAYRQMDVQSNDFAVYVSIRLQATEKWCPQSCPDEPYYVDIFPRVWQAGVNGLCCDCEEVATKDDGCEEARAQNPFGKEADQ